jgi:hypothetical protein
MTEPRPLLAFGPPAVTSIPPAPENRPRPPQSTRPSAGRQAQRLGPQFAALRDAMQAGRAELTDDTPEPDSELVVVFDLAGTVGDFYRAADGVPGLEFLAEYEDEEIEPDDDFHFVKDGAATDSPVTDTLYMVMSNAQAVIELISLFERWQADPTEQFARGLNPLRQVFGLLRAIRRWGPQDRIRETGLLDQWAEDVAVVGASGSVRVEIELWFRGDPDRRAQAQGAVSQIIDNVGGQVVTSAVVESVGYHAMLADLPYPQVEAVVSRGPDAIELLTTETVMFVSPSRPMSIPALEISDTELAADMSPAPSAPPRVALLDGLPLTNHVALAGRLVVDDPDEVAARYTADQTHHGTAMASLIAHGDLNAPRHPLTSKIYVRPILEPHPLQPDTETVIRDGLLVDLLHRSFLRMFEGDGQHEAAAPSVRIVNLSIGDPARVFDRRISPLAKLIDWMAHRYNLVILVSAGNHPITTSIPAAALDDPAALRQAVTSSTYQKARQRRLLSPAEAVNVLTVGALHADAATTTIPDTILDGIEKGMPALYNPVGFGHRRSVKPEILLPGGRSAYQRPPPGTDSQTNLTPARTSARGPGLRVATPGGIGVPNATAYSYGTSNATALATRTASHIIDTLESLTNDDGLPPFPDAQYHPVLAKTLLVHAASWGPIRAKLVDMLGLDPASARRDLSQILGYGAVDPSRVATASRTRVLLLGAGSITDGMRHSLSLPLPASLASTTECRRLTITLGWLSPVNTRAQRHRMARLFIQPPQNELGVHRVEADHHAVRHGTVQHEILEGHSAVAFATGDGLSIDVDCRIDSGKIETPIRYAVSASLELATTVQADVHAEVKQALQNQVRDRVATRTRS